MKKIYLMLLCAFWFMGVNAQNDCATAVAITIPYTSGTLTTCGTGDDYAVGSYFNSSYGGGEDYVFTFTVTNAPVTYQIDLGGTAIWKIASVHSACPPSSANAIGGVATSSGNSATGSITIPVNGTYYVIVDTWPTPTCGEFTLKIAPPPPPPSNDEASGAVALTVNTNLSCTTTTAGTTFSATASPDIAPGCSATGTNDDVWYTFVAANTTQIISFTGTSNTMAAALYTGTPGSLALVTGACASTTLTANGLTIGQTYYVRAYTTSATAGIGSNFNICVGTLPPPPSNDNAAGAIALTANSDYSCTTVTSGTTFSASQSPEAAPTCSATGINDDVWYSFTAVATGHRISFLNTSNTMAAALYSGTPGSLTLVTGACASTTLNTTGLTIGQTYYVRAFTTSATVGINSNFDICLGSPPPPPSNDECSGAISLTVNADLNCGVLTLGTTESSTSSTTLPAPTCYTASFDDDIWYKFTAAQPTHQITITNVSGPTDLITQIYSGSCSGLTLVLCSDPENFSVTGLTVGQTYFVRIATYNSTAPSANRSTFNICVGTPPSMSYVSSTTTQSSITTVTAGSVNQQIVRLQVVVAGSNSPILNMSQIDINTAGSTNPSVDIDSVKIYYTGSSSSFATTTQFGSAVANPSGPLSITGSQNLIGGTTNTTNYFWVVYNIACAATPTNVVDAQVTGFNVGTSQIPTVTDPTGTRAIVKATSTATTLQSSTATVLTGSVNNQILRVALTSCAGSVVTQMDFTTSGSTSAATDITAARVFYSATTTFSTAVQFGADVANPNGAFTVSGSQVLTNGTGYFWLVYDIAASATPTNVVDASNESSIVSGNALIPATPNPTGTRAIVQAIINDNAPAAIAITLGAGCPGVYYTNVNSSQSANEPAGSCASATGYGTVWFKFVAPASGAVRISTDEGSGFTLTDTRMGLFSATNVNDYGTFTILGCDEDGGVLGSGWMSIIYSTGLTPGNTYYIQVDQYSSSSTQGTFCLTVDELNSSMLSTAASCIGGQANAGTISTYTGWVNMLDNSGKLMASARNAAGGAVGNYTTKSQNINTGAVRTATYGTPYLDRNYLIANSSATNVEVQFFFLASELAALNAVDGTTLATLGVSRQTGNTCRADFSLANGVPERLTQTGNGTSGDGTVNWVTVNTPSFSNFYLHKGTEVLPITLEYFKGFKQDKSKNQLSWKVDCNNAANNTLILERSANQQSFTAIHSITTQATDACNLPSIFNDAKANTGMNYYRLKMVDVDGSFRYSNIVALYNGNQAFELVGLAPNPVKNITNLKIASDKSVIMNLSITDIAGRKVSTQKVQLVTGQNTISLDFSKLASGTYQITGITADATLQTIRFVKQ